MNGINSTPTKIMDSDVLESDGEGRNWLHRFHWKQIELISLQRKGLWWSYLFIWLLNIGSKCLIYVYHWNVLQSFRSQLSIQSSFLSLLMYIKNIIWCFMSIYRVHYCTGHLLQEVSQCDLLSSSETGFQGQLSILIKWICAPLLPLATWG